MKWSCSELLVSILLNVNVNPQHLLNPEATALTVSLSGLQEERSREEVGAWGQGLKTTILLPPLPPGPQQENGIGGGLPPLWGDRTVGLKMLI